MGEDDRQRTGNQYRRNQTLRSPRRDDDVASPRRRMHHLTIQRRKIGSVFLITLAVIIFLTILLTQLTAQISIAGTSVKTTKPFTDVETEYIEAVNSYYGIHPAERLRFLLNDGALSAYVGALYPEVKSLEIAGVKNAVETQFSIRFREPVAGWIIQGKQYYVDSDGVVFERNYFEVPLVQIVDESGVTPEEGTAVASGRLLGFVGKVVALSEGRGYTAIKAVLPAETTRRLDVTFEGIRPVVRFSIDRGAGEQVSDMAQSLQYLTTRGTQVEYIDVRVSGRTVYR